MTDTVTTIIAALGVAGQVLAVAIALVGLLALVGVRGPLEGLRGLLWGYELWSAFVVAAIATGGSLFFSNVAGFVPCELCWFQRICMYPLSLLALLLAWNADHRVARYLIPFPLVGAGVSIYHLLVENHVVATPAACQVGAGCTVKWIDRFGYMTIPTLALTGFVLLIEFFILASLGSATPAEKAATLHRHA